MARRDRQSARYSCSLRDSGPIDAGCGDPSRTDRLIPAPFVFGNGDSEHDCDGLLCCSSDEPPVERYQRPERRTSAHRWEELPCSVLARKITGPVRGL